MIINNFNNYIILLAMKKLLKSNRNTNYLMEYNDLVFKRFMEFLE